MRMLAINNEVRWGENARK